MKPCSAFIRELVGCGIHGDKDHNRNAHYKWIVVVFSELNCEPSRATVHYVPLVLLNCSPEVFVRDLLDVDAKELLGSVLVDVLQETFGASTLVPDQSHVLSVSHPAAQKTVKIPSDAKQSDTITVQRCDWGKWPYKHKSKTDRVKPEERGFFKSLIRKFSIL